MRCTVTGGETDVAQLGAALAALVRRWVVNPALPGISVTTLYSTPPLFIWQHLLAVYLKTSRNSLVNYNYLCYNLKIQNI